MNADSTPRHRVLKETGALDSAEPVGLGTRKAVEFGESAVYFPWPQPYARNRGIEPGTKANVYLHPETNVLVIEPTE